MLQGGAAGMVLYNPAPADIETDNHWLPTVHLRRRRRASSPSWPRTRMSTGSFTAGWPPTARAT